MAEVRRPRRGRECKGVWGNLRRKKCDEEQKKKLMKELHGLIRGKMKQMAFPHDSVRVLRCFIQFGNQKQRWEVFEELKDGVLTMSKYPYRKHVVKKLLMYGNKELVAAVIQMFKGHIRQMLRHAAASTIVEYAYNDKAVLAQKLMITDELYGPTYTICTHTHPECSVMSCSCSQRPSLCSFFVQSLEGNTIEKVVKENPEKLENIMDETKQVIVPLTQMSEPKQINMDFVFSTEKQQDRDAVGILTHF
ncbi:hypothetical protein CHARACLAT_025276 [Characodon lateralis]|uniref:PUM-HD domain-containing protein n=1 Tax=Characodon lateralis TaxID=208331 RepID=A0ABU7CV87_9TELE|nr:hypothetical protein [Characodon lateralis]